MGDDAYIVAVVLPCQAESQGVIVFEADGIAKRCRQMPVGSRQSTIGMLQNGEQDIVAALDCRDVKIAIIGHALTAAGLEPPEGTARNVREVEVGSRFEVIYRHAASRIGIGCREHAATHTWLYGV